LFGLIHVLPLLFTSFLLFSSYFLLFLFLHNRNRFRGFKK
jgi:hypothetical protein